MVDLERLLKVDVSKRIIGLDVLRSLAIFKVYYTHSRLVCFDYGPTFKFFNHYVFFYPGVGLFFVLSGFLIGDIILKLLEKEKFGTFKDIKAFWMRRWLRTLPNYFLVMLVTFLLWIVVVPASIPKILNKIIYYSTFCQNLFSNSHIINFFDVSWSLTVEEWFYLSLPLLIILFQTLKYFSNKTKRVGVALLQAGVFMVLSGVVARIILMGFLNRSHAEISKTVVSNIDAIGYGVIAAYLNHNFKNQFLKYKYFCLIFGTILLFTISTYLTPRFYLKSLEYNIFYLSLSSIAVAMLLPYFSSLRTLNVKIFVYLFTGFSVISYSFYLLHNSFFLVPVSSLCNILNFNPKENILFGLILCFSTFIVISLISYLNYYFFEKPIMDLRDKTSQYTKHPSPKRFGHSL